MLQIIRPLPEKCMTPLTVTHMAVVSWSVQWLTGICGRRNPAALGLEPWSGWLLSSAASLATAIRSGPYLHHLKEAALEQMSCLPFPMMTPPLPGRSLDTSFPE